MPLPFSLLAVQQVGRGNRIPNVIYHEFEEKLNGFIQKPGWYYWATCLYIGPFATKQLAKDAYNV